MGSVTARVSLQHLSNPNSNLRNFFYIYATTGTIPHRTINSYVSLCTTNTTGARSLCRGLLTTFTTLFGPPRALAHSFFTFPATYPLYLQYTLPIFTAAALNTSSNYTHCGPFLAHQPRPKPTHAPPVASFLILTSKIIPYYNESRRLTSSPHTHKVYHH